MYHPIQPQKCESHIHYPCVFITYMWPICQQHSTLTVYRHLPIHCTVHISSSLKKEELYTQCMTTVQWAWTMVILYSVSCEFKSACTVREFFLNVPDFRLPVFNLDCVIDCQLRCAKKDVRCTLAISYKPCCNASTKLKQDTSYLPRYDILELWATTQSKKSNVPKHVNVCWR